MTAVIVGLLPREELALLKCYIKGKREPDWADAFYDAIGVPKNPIPPRLEVAVAQILLHHVQGSLPQWSAAIGEEIVFLNRKEHKRHPNARLVFNPKLVCTINWADSGPGYSWPESYHVTYLPGFDKFVITASQDGPDVFGCSDQAIGFANGRLDPVEAARQAIVGYWCSQSNGCEQKRWAYLFKEGLIDKKTANDWADEAWPPEPDEAISETSSA